jgi:hypothetical protein
MLVTGSGHEPQAAWSPLALRGAHPEAMGHAARIARLAAKRAGPVDEAARNHRDPVGKGGSGMRIGSLARVALLGTWMLLASSGPASAAGLFGAIAFDAASGGYGFAHSKASRAEAEAAALAHCGRACRVVTWTQGRCIALAAGRGNGWGQASGETKDEAQFRAVQECSKHTTHCELRCWVCGGHTDGGAAPSGTLVQTIDGAIRSQVPAPQPPVVQAHPQQLFLTVTNATPLRVSVNWLDPQGREQAYRLLEPWESYQQPSHAGHGWVLRDVWSGIALASGTCTGPHSALEARHAALRSTQSSFPVQLAFTNHTAMAVDVYWVGFDGRETPYARIGSRGSWNVQSFATHVWRFRGPGGGLVDLFIARQQASQAYAVQDRRTARSRGR